MVPLIFELPIGRIPQLDHLFSNDVQDVIELVEEDSARHVFLLNIRFIGELKKKTIPVLPDTIKDPAVAQTQCDGAKI